MTPLESITDRTGRKSLVLTQDIWYCQKVAPVSPLLGTSLSRWMNRQLHAATRQRDSNGVSSQLTDNRYLTPVVALQHNILDPR